MLFSWTDVWFGFWNGRSGMDKWLHLNQTTAEILLGLLVRLLVFAQSADRALLGWEIPQSLCWFGFGGF